MAAALPTTALRKVFQERISLLASDVEALFETELESRVEQARRSSRREIAEALNQALRRLRRLESFAEVAATVVDSATRLCNSAAVFSVSGNTVKGECARGITGPALERFAELRCPLSDAAAFAGAIESQDPVISTGTPRELSPAIAEILPPGADERVALIPIVVREKAAALLYASGFEDLAPLELLANAAALWLEAHDGPAQPPAAELISIEAAKPADPARRIPASWSELPPHDQQIHLRAQRFARVQVAGMQLHAAEAVKTGRARGDLYQALEKDIDAAREVFRRSFVSACPTMVDYFHLELLRSLAHEDVALLGQSYPGPLV